MHIRTMEQKDIPAAAALEREIFSMPWSEQALRESLDNEYSIFLVAEEQGKVVGYMGMYTVLDEADVTNIAVDPFFRRRGIGRAILEEMLRRARAQKIAIVNLEVRVSNTGAIALYEQTGFQMIGRRKGFYEKPCEDAYLMQLVFQ